MTLKNIYFKFQFRKLAINESTTYHTYISEDLLDVSLLEGSMQIGATLRSDFQLVASVVEKMIPLLVFQTMLQQTRLR